MVTGKLAVHGLVHGLVHGWCMTWVHGGGGVVVWCGDDVW